VSYVAHWYDELGRRKATTNYGTNGGSALTRPAIVPDRSDDVLVTATAYNDRGEAYAAIDPAGREDRQEFDDAGRMVRTIQNYVDGTVDGQYPDEDVTVETTYSPDGQVLTLVAKNPTTGDQTTRYVYGTTLADSTIARSDLLRAVIYPDSDDTTDPLGDGNDTLYDRVELKYNRQGEVTERKDQNGTVHEYLYDALGRQTADKVTTVGTGVDGAVRRIERSYEVRGMLEKTTSYDAATGGNAVNEVVFEYSSASLLAKEYQEHSGAKDGNTLYAGYNYDTTASAGVFSTSLRPTSVRYPNGRLVHFTYGAAGEANDAMSRLAAINDDNSGNPGNSVAEYTYLGLGTIVVEDYPQPDVKLNYDSGTAGEYAGFDRFGRVVDHLWRDYGASVDRDRYTYGYDRASNRLYRENTTASGKDEFYTYDGVNQLKTFDRGDLNAQKTGISGTPVREEDWTLDMTGNWSGYVQKTSGTTDLNQTRGHNKANEITSASSWATPAHDRAGNMTTVPKPSSPANGLTLKYDAWNRLVEVKDGQTVVGMYEYDGQNRRIKKHIDSQSPASPNGIDRYEHFFYNSQWQILETRDTGTEADQPENLQPKYQYVWSARYIDAPVLRDKNTDADGLCDDERVYYLGDANFNVTCLVDTGGDALERYLYGVYGRVGIYDGTWSNTRSISSYSVSHLYTGRELDGESGLYQYRKRYYCADLGRFISRDPVETRQWYRYVRNNPLRKTDPNGLCAQTPGGDPYEHHRKCFNLAPSSDPTQVPGLGQPIHLLEFCVDCAVPKKAIPKCHAGLLKESPGVAKTRCEGAAAQAETDPRVRWLKQQIANTDRCGSLEIKPICRCFTGACAPFGGWYENYKYKIYFNQDRLEDVLAMYRHELTHLWQDCRKPSGGSCYEAIIRELEANAVQGMPGDLYSFQFAPAFRRAVASACAGKYCTPGQINQSLFDAAFRYWEELTSDSPFGPGRPSF